MDKNQNWKRSTQTKMNQKCTNKKLGKDKCKKQLHK